jgi:hypothetical protein
MTKIDILFNVGELITVINDETQILKIDEFEGIDLTLYQDFIAMVNNRQHIEYNQLFITDYYIKRYALILQEHLTLKAMEEVLYEDLTNDEKIIYDNFYNNFTN